FLREDGVVQVVAALTAVLLGVLESEVAVRGELVEDLVGEPALVLPLLRVRRELALDEAPRLHPEVLVLLRERGRHAPLGTHERLRSHSTTSSALRSGGNTG